MEQFLNEVEAYLEASGMPDTHFGPAISEGQSFAAGRGFVYYLRKGHKPSFEKVDAARAYMASHPAPQKNEVGA